MAESFRKSIRGKLNAILFNSLFTSTYDRLRPPRSIGARGERFAERYLLKSGYVIVGRSYSDIIGELDLIAVDGDTIVFTEVKTRTSDVNGSPAEAVDEDKQHRITKTALSYLKRHELLDCRIRFDVIAIEWPQIDKHPKLEHFQNAFAAPENSW